MSGPLIRFNNLQTIFSQLLFLLNFSRFLKFIRSVLTFTINVAETNCALKKVRFSYFFPPLAAADCARPLNPWFEPLLSAFDWILLAADGVIDDFAIPFSPPFPL
jgi:hypothetical protein